MSRRKIRKGSPQKNVPNEGRLDFSAIFDQYVAISWKRCILDTKLLWDGNRKLYASYWMVSLSMALSDPSPGFQGHGSFKRRVAPKRGILQTQLLYRTLIGNHRHAIPIDKLDIRLTTPLLLHKPCKLFASVARVCQRQLAFLVWITNGLWQGIWILFFKSIFMQSAANMLLNYCSFWQYKVYMRIFAGVPWRRGVKWQWGNRKRPFSGLSGAASSAP